LECGQKLLNEFSEYTFQPLLGVRSVESGRNAQTDPTTYLATALGGDDRGAVWAAALVTVTGVATMADLALVDDGMAGDAAVACGIPLVPTKKLKIALTQLRASLRGASLRTTAPPEAEMKRTTAPPEAEMKKCTLTWTLFDPLWNLSWEKRKTWSVWIWLAIVFFPITLVLFILYCVCFIVWFAWIVCNPHDNPHLHPPNHHSRSDRGTAVVLSVGVNAGV
jgi:nitrate reductase NapE component